MRRIMAATVAVLALLVVWAGSAVAGPTATITFSLNTTTCDLTITSTKDISNINGVEPGTATTTVTIPVVNGQVITVKSGITTASFTVSGCGHIGDPHDPHDGHTGPDSDHDGDHDADDHH
jgi:type 1 fimbria pilin